jgi:hypothetical protein
MPEPTHPKRGKTTENVTVPSGAKQAESAAAAEGTPRRRERRSAWPEASHPGLPANSIAVERQRERDDARGSVRPEGPRSQRQRGGRDFDPESVLTDAIRENYVQVGPRFHFPGTGDPAFRIHADRTTTRSVDPEVIRHILELEHARAGTDPLRLRGTVEFRAEAWKQAQLAGIAVRGYRPSELERAQVARTIEREQRRGQDAAAPRPSETVDRPSPSHTPDSPARTAPERERAVEPEARSYRGKLVEKGTAHYQNNPKEDLSYYVKIETRSGRETLWGKDFERAIDKSLSHVKVGDHVGINHAGETPVIVTARRKDEDGRYTRHEEVAAIRNRWIVETQEFLKEREELARVVRDPTITPQQAVQRYPNLTGTYVEIHAAQVAALHGYPEEDREKFVTRFRNEVANEIARGETLPVAKVRNRSAEATRNREPRERQQERVLS